MRAITGGPNKMTISAGWGMFYNPIEQLVLEQFSAEPPFGGSTFISDPVFQAPFVAQSGGFYPNPFNGILNPHAATADRLVGLPFDSFVWTISAVCAHPVFGAIQFDRETRIANNLIFQVGYVGSQGHRLLASHDLNYGNPQACNDLQAISTLNNDPSVSCGPQSADNSYFVSPNDNIPVGGLTLPYGGPNGGATVFLPGGGNVGAKSAGTASHW